MRQASLAADQKSGMLSRLAISCAAHLGLIVLISSSKAMMAAPVATPDIASVPMIVVSVPADALSFVTPAAVAPATPASQPTATAARLADPPETEPSPAAPAASPSPAESASQLQSTSAAAAPPPEIPLATTPVPAESAPEPVAAPASSEVSVPPVLSPHRPATVRDPATHTLAKLSHPHAVSRPRAALASAPAEDALPPRTVETAKDAAPQLTVVSAAAEASFEGRLLQAVQAEAQRSYPAAARMMGVTGQAAVGFEYRDGTVRVTGLSQSSGSPMLDRAALAAVQDARYPAAPAALAGRTLAKLVHVRFELNPS